MKTAPILQAIGVTKGYGRVVAIDGSDLELFPGEVLAVVGDNGRWFFYLKGCTQNNGI